MVVKDIIDKAWNTTKPMNVSLIDKNVFLFSFNHEVELEFLGSRIGGPGILKASI